MAPNIEPCLLEITNCFPESAATKAKDTIKRSLRSNVRPQDSSETQESLFEGFKRLNESGYIDFPDGETKLLEMLAKRALADERTGKKEQVLNLIQSYKSQFPSQEKMFGREKDMKKILNFLSNPRVPGLNLFGESGVGKTTLAKEVSKNMKEFVTLSIDLRGTQDINNVYFKVLESFNLAKSDYNKERIYTHLQNLTSKTLLLLDNVEQFLSKEKEADQEARSKFLEFLEAITVSDACIDGHFKVLLTSTIQIDEPRFKHALFVEYKLEPFSKKESTEYISRRVKDADLDQKQEKAAVKISDHCKDIIYLLRAAEQLKRERYSTSLQVLGKIAAQIEKGVPEQFACISALFESLPNDHLKQIAVKISLLQRPFSVFTAMKVIEMSSEHDTEWDLELLVTQKIITAEDVNGERKYDVHDRFREFVTSYLCKEDPVSQEHLNKGKEKFAENFSDELVKLSEKLESDFVVMFKMLEDNRPNFEKTIDIIIEEESFDLLFYSDDLKKAGLLSLLFKYVVNNQKRRELFKSWSENSEKRGNLLISAYIKCWEALLSAEMEGISCGFITLNQAKRFLDQVHKETSNQGLFDMTRGMYLFSKGHLKYQEAGNLTDQSSSETKKMTKRILKEALSDLEESLMIHQKVYGDHSLTARSLDLMGNCYMQQFEPEKAESFYQEAMCMKLNLIGSEKHDDIVHYYNQLSQVHQMMGDKIMKGPFDLKKVMGPLLPYQKRAKKEYELAAKLLKVALDLQENLGVCDTEDTATFERNLANLNVALKNYDEALKYAEKSYKTRYCLLKEHPETVRILYLIGIIHEWRKDHKAALASYEKAFVMEESLPEDNHSVVRKLLCDRLEAMCKKGKEKNKLKEYGPRIKAIKQIKSSQHHPEEPAVQVSPTTRERDEQHLETAEEPTEEEVPDYLIQGDITEETPLFYTEPVADTEHTVQEDLPGTPLQPDVTPVTPTEPGIADTEHPVQEDLPGTPLQPDDTPVTPTEPGIADTEHTVQEDLPGTPLQPDDTPVTPTEPGIADTEHPVQEDLPGTPLQPDVTPVTPTEPGIADTEHPVQVDLPGTPLQPDVTPVTPTEPGIADTEHPVQVDLPGTPLQPDVTPVTPTEPGIADTGHPVQEDLPGTPLQPDVTPVTPTEPGIADTGHPVQEDLDISVVTGIIDEIPPQCITINPEGGTLDIPMIGIRLDVPPNTVTQATTVICKKYTAESLSVTFPAGKDETVVSYIVGLEPSTIRLNKPISVSLMHSGPGKEYGYEIIVKAFSQDNVTWQEPKVLDRRQVKVSEDCRKDYVEVQISTLTILAVVTRLITDPFQVTPKGCVVRSSVCDDVTIEFPQEAVDKTVEGIMKVILVDTWKKDNEYPLPILCVDGFDDVHFKKLPIIKLPQPCPEKYSESQICVLCLEDSKTISEKESQWKDITEQIHIEENEYSIQLHVTHFSWLSGWKWKDIPPITYISKAYEYLYSPPTTVCFAAFKLTGDSFNSFKLGLLCVDNKRLEEFQVNSQLSLKTGEAMRKNEKAYVQIKGDFVQDESDAEPVFLCFLGKEVYKNDVYICKKAGIYKDGEEMLKVFFHAENDEKRHLCKLSHKAKDIPSPPKWSTKVASNVNLELSNEQKRWVDVGIGLNKTLLPPLRDFLKKEMYKHYDDLKTKHSIDNQSHSSHLPDDHGKQLHYKSINNNKKHPYDYNVKSAEDLGKLYLMPNMAKFTGFDDTCDMSAVLGILSSASVFPSDVQKLASDVRSDVRNPWGHCNFLEWDDTKFTRCFQLMRDLLQALKLPEDDEKRITDELGEWETIGVGADSMAKFIEFAQVEIKRLSQEVKRLEANEKAEAEKIAATLRDILDILVKENRDKDKKLEALDTRVTALEQNSECSDKKKAVLTQKQESCTKRLETVEQKVKEITSITDEDPVECFGIVITDRYFNDLPEDIFYIMSTYLDDKDIQWIKEKPWKPEKFLRKFPKKSYDRKDCLQHLVDVLCENFPVAMSGLLELLGVGKELVTTPLKDNQELKEKTIEIVSRNPNICWETLAGHLQVDEKILKKCREDYSGDTHKVTSQMLREWIETSDKSCTLEIIFDALRLCGYRKTGEELASCTTEKCKDKIALLTQAEQSPGAESSRAHEPNQAEPTSQAQLNRRAELRQRAEPS